MVCAAVEWSRALNVSNLLLLVPFSLQVAFGVQMGPGGVLSKTNKQANKQLGRFLPPSWAFFPSVLNTLRAMIITNIRGQDGAEGRAFARSTFLEALGNALPGEC